MWPGRYIENPAFAAGGALAMLAAPSLMLPPTNATGPGIAVLSRANGAAAVHGTWLCGDAMVLSGFTQPQSPIVRTPGRPSAEPPAVEPAWFRMPQPPAI